MPLFSFLFIAIYSIHHIVHVYPDYSLIHDVIDNAPGTLLYSVVKMRETLDDVDASKTKKQRKSIDLMKMTPWNWYLPRSLNSEMEFLKCQMYVWFVYVLLYFKFRYIFFGQYDEPNIKKITKILAKCFFMVKRPFEWWFT